ncbi:MAG: glutathione peroxidase [Kordiimonadaceae bacterium]|nr:glutathione peroxidase [Kordiimonadaceae bacterium]
MSAHDFTLQSIEYKEMPLSQYKGKAVLLVNTASLCGFTPQYKGLQKLWSDYRAKGLVVLGVPSNDFGGQEPDDEGDIKEFCQVNFQVDFPMTTKMVVNGSKDNAPIYDWLAEELGDASRPKWNFHKYLISPEGKALAFFPSTVEPNSAKLIAAVGQALGN